MLWCTNSALGRLILNSYFPPRVGWIWFRVECASAGVVSPRQETKPQHFCTVIIKLGKESDRAETSLAQVAAVGYYTIRDRWAEPARIRSGGIGKARSEITDRLWYGYTASRQASKAFLVTAKIDSYCEQLIHITQCWEKFNGNL